ncbi:hypothetical protein CTAYLR_010053 [Chrysophaeum taylorii]|uniref:C2HC/C3H-type domain-containing protein n=1 Tax=Chrysophaeum taylorii TaxID=2483200 RepID=A0AAD7XGJ9_9STRA|nr:hypothetical protein CTAYLR_010053 [Chrysophaeum taylorii]
MPRDVGCPICGRRFFPHSLPIHLPQCKKKQDVIEVPCQWCDLEFPRAELAAHERKCRERKCRDRLEGSTAPTTGDHRIACRACGRKFNPDRIAKHQSICRKISGEKKEASVVWSTPERLLRTPERLLRAPVRPTKNEATEVRQAPVRRTKKEASVVTQAPAPVGWQEKSRATRALVRDAKRVHRAQEAGVPLSEIRPSQASEDAYAALVADFVPCPHCHRTFAPQTAERHIPKCATTAHRPQGPPRHMRRR